MPKTITTECFDYVSGISPLRNEVATFPHAGIQSIRGSEFARLDVGVRAGPCGRAGLDATDRLTSGSPPVVNGLGRARRLGGTEAHRVVDC